MSFRYVSEDFENAYPNHDDEWEVPTIIRTYPKFIQNHANLEGLYCVPDQVLEIYQETLLAIREDAAMLAGLGLRGTIEAVCNERAVTGKNLEVRISKLATQGWISQKDAERLHAIRFLGNDAAHDIKKPSKSQVEIALRIIEHLIVTVYILENAARGNLDTIVTNFEEFKVLLDSHLSPYSSGDEYPLAKFLGKDVRRIQGALSQMETQLIAEIQAGSWTRLLVGKIDSYGASPAQLQHFKLP